MAEIVPVANDDQRAFQRRLSDSSSSDVKGKADVERAGALVSEDEKGEGARGRAWAKKLRVGVLIALAALIFAWWVSSTVLKATRGRWQVHCS
ncbi:hypothetical protein JVU11DRAFT_2732 [Chiua virens]|nr:hypothetical protein JVU11DRAFT_2732 [Chiua virens]